MKTDEEGILELVMAFCLSSDFEQRFRDFADRHAATFEHVHEAEAREEHPLSYHQAYQQYLDEFEGYIEGFINRRGSSLQEFYRQAKAALEDEEHSTNKFFVEALVALSEYSEFVSLMRSEVHSSRK